MCQNKHQSFDYFGITQCCIYTYMCYVQRSHDNSISKLRRKFETNSKVSEQETTNYLLLYTFYRDTKIRIVDLIERI